MYKAGHSTGLNLSLGKACLRLIHRFMLCLTRCNILSGKSLRIHWMSATCFNYLQRGDSTVDERRSSPQAIIRLEAISESEDHS